MPARRLLPRTGADPLLANAQRLTDRPVAVDVLALEVIEQTAALTDEHQQPTPRMMVLGVHLEVLREGGDTLGKERDLDLGGPGVARHAGELLYDLCLLNCGQTHLYTRF